MNRNSLRLQAYLSISVLLGLSFWTLLYLPEHLAQNSWSSQKIGWAMGSFFLTNLLAQMAASTLAQRFGNVYTALVGAVLGAVGGLAYLSSLGHLDLLFLARILHGAAAGLITASVLIHLVESVPPELKGRMIGYFGLPGFLLMGVGPLFAQFLQSRWGMSATFWAVFVSYALTAWPLLTLPRPLIRRSRMQKFSRAMRVNFPRLRSILLMCLMFGIGFSVWPSFLAPAVSHLGTTAVSVFGLGYGTGAVASRLGFSQILRGDRRGRVIAFGLVLFGLLLGLLPHLGHPWLFSILGVACGAVHGIYYPALSSIAAERFHPLVPGHGMSLYISTSSLGLFLGPPIWGIVADRTSYLWTFAAAGAVLISAALLFVRQERRATQRGPRHGPSA